jgi:putative flippase GtrA
VTIVAWVREFWRFLLLGGLSAGVNWTSRHAYSQVMPFSQAVIAAYLTGMAVAFVLFRLFVFPKGSRPISRQVSWFVMVNLVGMAQVWVVSMLLVTIVFPAIGFTWHAEGIGHGLAMATPVATSFLGHKYLTYRR